MEPDMHIFVWHVHYPDYAKRMEALALNVHLLQSGKIPCTLTLVPR